MFSLAFTIKEEMKCIPGARQISPVLDGDPLSLTFTFLPLLTPKILRNSFKQRYILQVLLSKERHCFRNLKVVVDISDFFDFIAIGLLHDKVF